MRRYWLGFVAATIAIAGAASAWSAQAWAIAAPQPSFLVARAHQGTIAPAPGGNVLIRLHGVYPRVDRLTEGPLRASAPTDPARLVRAWKPAKGVSQTIARVELLDGNADADTILVRVSKVSWNAHARTLSLLGRLASTSSGEGRLPLSSRNRDRMLPSEFGRTQLVFDRQPGGPEILRNDGKRHWISWAVPAGGSAAKRASVGAHSAEAEHGGAYGGQSASIVSSYMGAVNVNCLLFTYASKPVSVVFYYRPEDPANNNEIDPGWTYSGPGLGAALPVSSASTLGYASFMASVQIKAAPAQGSDGGWEMANTYLGYSVQGAPEEDYVYYECNFY
jgi:hypothetical protein